MRLQEPMFCMDTAKYPVSIQLYNIKRWLANTQPKSMHTGGFRRIPAPPAAVSFNTA